MIYTVRGTDEFGDDLYAGMEDDGSIVLWGPSRKHMLMERVTQDNPETYVHPTGFTEVRSDDPVYLGATMMMFTGMLPELVQGEPPEGKVTFEVLGAEPDRTVGEALVSGMIELACYGKVCAPPPVGRGGSVKGGPGGYHLAVAGEQWQQKQDSDKYPHKVIEGMFPNAKVRDWPGTSTDPSVHKAIAEAAANFPEEVRNSIELVVLGMPEQRLGGGFAAFGDGEVEYELLGRAEGSATKTVKALIFTDRLTGSDAFERLTDGVKHERSQRVIDEIINGKAADTMNTGLIDVTIDTARNQAEMARIATTHELGHATEYLMASRRVADKGMLPFEEQDYQRLKELRPHMSKPFYLMTRRNRDVDWPSWSSPGLSGFAVSGQTTEYGGQHKVESFAEGVALAALGHPMGKRFLGQIADHEYGVNIDSVLNTVRSGSASPKPSK